MAPERILLISVDTLRPDHLGCYGYPRATSPHLDALARRGTQFSDVMSTAPWTLPAHTSLLTGLYPGQHRVQEDSAALPADVPTLAGLLARHGYATLAVVSHDYVSSIFGLDRGFDRFDDSLIEGFLKNPVADTVVEEFLENLRELSPGPFFGFLHLFDPHWDYAAPAPYPARFTRPGYAGAIDGTYATIRAAELRGVDDDDLTQLRGLYDAEIAYLDSRVGRLLEALDEAALLDGMLIAFTADHGEEFEEHGWLGHGRMVCDDQVRVPLLVAGHAAFPPGPPRPDPVSIVDVAPTLAEMVGGAGEETFSGESLLRPPSPDRLRIAETIQFGNRTRCVRIGPYKLMRVGTRQASFDLRSDPGEHHEIPRDPTGGRLVAALNAYRAAADRGWHVMLVAAPDHPLHVAGTVRTEGRIVEPKRYFSQVLSMAGAGASRAEFPAFELSEDGRELRFDAEVSAHRGEIVFRTEPADAEVTIDLRASGAEGEAAPVLLGSGQPLPPGQPARLAPGDERVQGLVAGYPNVATGCYIRAVPPPDRAELPEGTQERLRALGYIE